MRNYLKAAAMAILTLAVAAAAHAQSDRVLVYFPYGGADLIPDSEAIATEKLPADIRSIASGARASLAVVTDTLNNHCYTEVGFVLPETKMARMPTTVAWSASEVKPGEPKPAACARAFTAATTRLASVSDLAEAIRKAVEDEKAPGYVVPRDLPPKGFMANMNTTGLSDAGRDAIVDTLGEKFTTVFDYRRFTVRVALRDFKTLEGRSMCRVDSGLTARTRKGVSPRFPAQLSTSTAVNKLGDDTDCTRKAFEHSLQQLAADPVAAYANFSTVADPGVKYPTAQELKAAIASFDHNAEKKRKLAEAKEKAAAAKRDVVSRTTSHNALTCTNECYNGMCTRTFPNGRKERWQAPRKYNPFTRNWEWDTTTNACGG